VWNGQVIAESGETIEIEGNQYFSPGSVRHEFLVDNEQTTVCPWKGTASYYDVVVEGESAGGGDWYYPSPRLQTNHAWTSTRCLSRCPDNGILWSMKLNLPRVAALTAVLFAALALAACGSGSSDGSGDPATAATGPTPGFEEIQLEARGQTVRWWMYGGDPRFNAFVDDVVKPAAAEAGVKLVRVPINDTADAVNRVVAEERAGKSSGGGVDLIWINGENFASGKEAGLWREDWADALPNMRFTDPESSLLTRDFGVEVDGQESPWSRAAFVYAYDSSDVADPPKSFPELLEYAKENPGRFAYPAPPDFTGSAFVRQVVQRLGSVEAAMDYLEELKPFTYAEGNIQPKSEQELSQLFANGQVDFTMSYNSNFIDNGVIQGQFPDSSRPFLIGNGALQNASFATIPANASSPEGAQVVANLLIDPAIQATMQDPETLGMLSVLDPGRLSGAEAEELKPTRSPYMLASLGEPLNELPASEVAEIDDAWIQQVQR